MHLTVQSFFTRQEQCQDTCWAQGHLSASVSRNLPELTYEHYTCEVGCRCLITAVIPDWNDGDLQIRFGCCC